MDKQKQIDWLYQRLCSYESYINLRDDTFKDDVKTDLDYAEKYFDITPIIKKCRVGNKTSVAGGKDE